MGNPCPCGFFPDRNRCKCSQLAIERYQRSISKPILERIDICAETSSIKFDDIAKDIVNENSQSIRERVLKARSIQSERFKNYSNIKYNSQMTAKEIKKFCVLSETEVDFIKKIYKVKKLSARTYHKLLKVARTIADLDGKENIENKHLVEAASYRGLEEHLYA